MNVSADVVYLPMLNPVRMPVREHALARHPADVQQQHAHRIYRLKPRQRPDGFAYGPAGHAATQPTTGRLIDLYA